MFDSMALSRLGDGGGLLFYSYKINQSCRFNDDDSAYLSYTQVAGNRRKWTVSLWLKRCNLSIAEMPLFYGNSVYEFLRFESGDTITAGFNGYNKTFVPVFRDPTGWVHVLWAVDTEQATAANRSRLYINGIEITSYTGSDPPLNNDAVDIGVASTVIYLAKKGSQAVYGDFYLAEPYFIDGSQLTPFYFGKFKYNIWIPKDYSVPVADNNCKLDFADSADLGNDVSGNNNDWTPSGLTSDDQVEDSPTNNYPVLNTLTKDTSPPILSNGSLQVVTAVGGYGRTPTTFALPTTGKWYWEVDNSSGSYTIIGIIDVESVQFQDPQETERFTDGVDAYGYWGIDGNKYNNGSGSAYGATYTTGDIIGIKYNADNGSLEFLKNNISQGVAWTGLTKRYSPCIGDSWGGASSTLIINFGQLGFTYTPPSGFKALCSNNLSNPSIRESSTGFDVLTWTGDDTSPRDVSGLEFQPDAVWIKNRDMSSNHVLTDSVRGASKTILPNDTDTESTNHINGYVSGFNSDGFELTAGSSGDRETNDSPDDYVAWCFRKGTKYGFDIQTYTGTGVAHAENHDLGDVPELIIVKNLESVSNWPVYHHHALNKTDPETDFGYLDTVSAWADNIDFWNDTAPTSTQFTVGTNVGVNENTKNHIAYLWRSIPQFSKVFSYTGNGNADGTFVWCGFRPRYLLVKSTDSTLWFIIDTERATYNPTSNYLRANAGDSEDTVDLVDILSNGFKLRNSNNTFNKNAITFVGIAYAEQPVKYSNAR